MDGADRLVFEAKNKNLFPSGWIKGTGHGPQVTIFHSEITELLSLRL